MKQKHLLLLLVLLGGLILVGCKQEQADDVNHHEPSTVVTSPATETSTMRPSRQVYADRLRAMWLGESIANWTGLVTENMRTEEPFFTDEDWATRQGNTAVNGTGLIDFTLQDPWGADDDTDIEYIYLDTMTRLGRTELTAEEIREAWNAHILPDTFIWVSNQAAHNLMRASPYVLPPSTSFFAANDQSLMIDAQLTTEIFGALMPGMPVRALQIADLPIRVTASGFAAHAAQFHVALYSLAPVADTLPPRERILWMVQTARRLIPDTSKSADVIDFVLADFLSNPDVDDWERTRDAVAIRYQEEAEANGFRYLETYESSVNLATGLIALLYGEGDYRRTVQIGTLSGWDSDNGTATMGGLLGLMFGTEAIHAAFPEVELADEYNISRTRIGFDVPKGIDTFAAMADRMIPLAEQQIVAAGGTVDNDTGEWVYPAIDFDALGPEDNVLTAVDARSGNNHLQRAGEVPVVSWAGVAGDPPNDESARIVDGIEFDYAGTDRLLPARNWFALQARRRPQPFFVSVQLAQDAEEIEVTIVWQASLRLQGVRFVEGPHQSAEGGWFETLAAQIRVGGEWVAVESQPTTGSPSPDLSFEIVEWLLDAPTLADGVRIHGKPGGSTPYVTIAELEGTLATEQDQD